MKYLPIIIFLLSSSLSIAYTLTIYPSDDSFVDSSNPNTNYGNSALLYVDNNAIKRTIIKWDIPNEINDIDRVDMYLYASTHQIGAYTYLKLFSLNNNMNWTETSIVWNNQPSIGNEIIYACLKEPYDANNYGACYIPENVALGTEYIINITDYVINKSIDNKISFFISQGILDGDYQTAWASKENVNPNYRPKLVIEYSGIEPTTTSTSTTTTSSTSTTFTTTTKTTTTSTLITTTSTSITTTTMQPTTTSSSTTTSSTTTSSTSSSTTTFQTTTTSTIPPLSSMKKPVLISGSGFWEMLRFSSLGYPVLVWNESDASIRQKQSYFIASYYPSDILVVGANVSLSPYKITYIDISYLRKNARGFVIADQNKSNAILAAAIAKEINYTLIYSWEINGSEFQKETICDFSYQDCDISITSEASLMDFFIDKITSRNKSANHISLANINSNESALSVALDSIPVPVYIVENYSGSTDEINSINMIESSTKRVNNITHEIFRMKGAKEYPFDDEFSLSLFGMPYAVVDDPCYDNFFNLSDGEMLYTDNPYYDTNGDGYPDVSVGRFCCSPDMISFQIANKKIWDDNEKKALVMAEYRVPKYLDLFAFDGMTSGFQTEWSLIYSGFKTERLVEIRSLGISDFVFDKLAEIDEVFEYIKLLEPEFWVEKSFEFLDLKQFSDFKYGLLEYDWNDYGIPPSKLQNLSREHIFSKRTYAPVIFYFGMGDRERWFLPSGTNDSYLNPYPPLENISAYELNFSWPVALFDEHSLSASPGSVFVSQNSFIYVGSTGTVHENANGPGLAAFLDSIGKGKSFGYAVRKMKSPHSVSSPSAAGPTSATIISELKIMEKENYMKMLYGDPTAKIDPTNTGAEKYSLFPTSNGFMILGNLSLSYDIFDFSLGNESYSEIRFDGNPDYYIYDCGKPTIPVFKKEYILSNESGIPRISIINSSKTEHVMPPILSWGEFSNCSENFTEFPSLNYWEDYENLLDGRKLLTMNFAPVRYTYSDTAIIYNFSYIIEFSSPFEIYSVSVNDSKMGLDTPIYVSLSSPANVTIRITGNNYSNEYEFFSDSGFVNYTWIPNMPGNYLVMVFAASEHGISGPIGTNFTVYSVDNGSANETQNSTKYGNFVGIIRKYASISYNENEIYNFIERAFYSERHDRVIFSYNNPRWKINVEKSPTNETLSIIMQNISFIKFSNASITEKAMKTPRGTLAFSQNNGAISESCTSNCQYLESLMSELESTLATKLAEIKSRIDSGELPIKYIDS